jgi:hypothetical protein
MKNRQRLNQMQHVRENIRDLLMAGRRVDRMSYSRLRTLLVNGFRVMEGVSPERYTAMVKSVVKGHTTDEDIIWHLYNHTLSK